MNQYNAARAAGYSENYSRQAKPEKVVKDSMIDLLEQAGLTDKKLINFAITGLRANKLYGKDAVEYPDWPARHKFFETILKLANKIKETPLIDQSQHTHAYYIQQALSRAEMIDANGYFR